MTSRRDVMLLGNQVLTFWRKWSAKVQVQAVLFLDSLNLRADGTTDIPWLTQSLYSGTSSASLNSQQYMCIQNSTVKIQAPTSQNTNDCSMIVPLPVINPQYPSAPSSHFAFIPTRKNQHISKSGIFTFFESFKSWNWITLNCEGVSAHSF